MPVSDNAIVMLLAIAISISGLTLLLWRRYRSRRALLRRVTTLEALSEAGRAIVAADLDVLALIELIAEEARKVIDTRTFQIGLFQGNDYVIHHWTINGETQPTPARFDLSDDAGVVGWIRDSRQSLLVTDFRREMARLPARPRYFSEEAARSAIFIPLVSGERTIGLMAAQSDEPGRFHERDRRPLTILGNHAAAAIENAQLYAVEKRRAAQLELVLQIAEEVNAQQDLDAIFDLVVERLPDTFDLGPVNIFSVAPDGETAVIHASSAPALADSDLTIPPGAGLIGEAIRSRRTVVAGDTKHDQRVLATVGNEALDEAVAATRAEIAIPLLVDKTLVGVLDVHSPYQDDFNVAEQTVLEALAAAVSGAVRKANTLAMQREQAWVTTAQLQVAEAITRSRELDELVTALTHLTVILTGVLECGILLWEDEEQLYRGLALYGASAFVAERFEGLELSIGDWPPLDAVHVGHSARTTERRAPWHSSVAESGPTTLYPLIANDRIVGVMTAGRRPQKVESPILAPMPSRHEELMLDIAARASLAIESTLLRIAQEEEAWVNTALLQVAEAVNRLISLDEILDTIVRYVPILAGVNSCLLLVRDAAKGTYRVGAGYGLGEMGYAFAESLEIRPQEFSSLATLQPTELTPSSTYYRLQLPPWLRRVMNTSTAHAFPLYARRDLVGALIVGPSTNERPLGGRRLNILTGIAHQAATAVVNHALAAEAAERDRLQQELEVAHHIQASLIPPGQPDIPGFEVTSLWQAARQVSGDFYDFMRFPDGRWGVVVADVADKGMPAALFMAVCRTILRTVAYNRRSPADTLERVNELLLDDVASDLFVTVFYTVWDPADETLQYANAGHNPPLLISAGGAVHRLTTPGIALGVIPDIAIGESSCRLDAGDLLVIYTDGVTEAMNVDGDEFGVDRLQLVLGDGKGRADDIAARIATAVHDHAGSTPQSDDITFVVLKRPPA